MKYRELGKEIEKLEEYVNNPRIGEIKKPQVRQIIDIIKAVRRNQVRIDGIINKIGLSREELV